ncbi:MAG: MFS transporter [Sedimentisphaeraceae bacterium JB056]
MSELVRQSNFEDRKLSGHRRKSFKYAYMTSIAASISAMCMLSNPLQLFVIKMGASEFYLGLLSFFAAYAGFFSILSLTTIETSGKRVVMLRGWLITAFIMLPMVFLPFIAKSLPQSSKVILWIVIGLVALRGIFDGYGSTAWFPILQDNVPARITGKFFARFRLVWQSCLLVLVWGMSYYLGNDATYEKFAVIFAIGTLCLFSRSITAYKMSELPPKPPQKQQNTFRRILNLLKYKQLRTYICYLVAINIGLFMPVPFQIKMLKNFDYSDGYIMLATSMIQLASIITLRFWGKISDRYGNRAVFSICVIGNMITISLWILVDINPFSKIFIFVLYFLWGMFTAGNGIAQTRHMLHSTPRNNQAAIVLITIISSISLALAPLIGGILLSATKGLSIKSGAINLNNYHILFLLSALLFTIPYNLRRKLRITKEDSTNYVMSSILRPLRQAIGSHIRVVPPRLFQKDDNSDN